MILQVALIWDEAIRRVLWAVDGLMGHCACNSNDRRLAHPLIARSVSVLVRLIAVRGDGSLGCSHAASTHLDCVRAFANAS